MVLDELVDRIEALKTRIASHGNELRENETRTRMALIDPLLHALGWDVSDPGMVKPEYKIGNGWADYALLRPDGKPAAAVEAKKLGGSLTSHRMQMLNYANASGIDYAALTDGDHWELYSVFERGQLGERLLLDVFLVGTPVHECALKLLLLWRPNLASDRPTHVSARIPGEAQRPMPTPAAPTPAGVEEAPPPPRPASPGWVALPEYDRSREGRRPMAVRLWDGHERAIKRWYELLTGVVEKLYSEGRLTVDNVPIPYSDRISIVHTEPIHPTGRPFTYFKSIDGTPLFVNVSSSILRKTQRLLLRCGLNPAEVYLRGRS